MDGKLPDLNAGETSTNKQFDYYDQLHVFHQKYDEPESHVNFQISGKSLPSIDGLGNAKEVQEASGNAKISTIKMIPSIFHAPQDEEQEPQEDFLRKKETQPIQGCTEG